MKSDGRTYRDGKGGGVFGSDKAAEWESLHAFKEVTDKMFITTDGLENDLGLSVNHPYFSVKEMEARDKALEILHQTLEVLRMLMPVGRNVGGRPRVHKDNAAKQKAHRNRKKNELLEKEKGQWAKEIQAASE